MRAERRQAGFTLLETLIALAIFALLGVAAYAGLDSTLQTRARLDQDSRQWRDIALLWARVGRDLAAAANIPARPSGAEQRPPLLGEALVVTEDGAQLELTRLGEGRGDSEEDAAFAAPQRIGYRLRDGRVEWLRWPGLDNAPRTLPEINVLLENVAFLGFSFLDSAGTWSARWPGTAAQARPVAVRVTLQLESGERMSRLYAF